MIQLDKHMAIRPMGRIATAPLKCLLHISKHCSPSYEHQPVLGAAAECGQGLNHGLGTTKNMRVHMTLDPGTTSGIRAQAPDALAVHGMVRALLRGKQPVLRFAPAPINK